MRRNATRRPTPLSVGRRVAFPVTLGRGARLDREQLRLWRPHAWRHGGAGGDRAAELLETPPRVVISRVARHGGNGVRETEERAVALPLELLHDHVERVPPQLRWHPAQQ